MPSVYFLLALVSWGSMASLAGAQERPPVRVCVAVITNGTSKSLLEDRLTTRLARDLSNTRLIAVVMDSTTTSDRELHATLENSEEVKRRECDFLVLTQVSDPRSRPTDLAIPPISIGGRAPSVDASDPLGGQSGPQYRDSLDVNFAVFRTGSPKSVLNTKISDQPSGNVSDSMMQAIDREANRIGHDLKKK